MITHTRIILVVIRPRYKSRIEPWIISCSKPIAIIATTKLLTGVRKNFHLTAKDTFYGKKLIGIYA